MMNKVKAALAVLAGLSASSAEPAVEKRGPRGEVGIAYRNRPHLTRKERDRAAQAKRRKDKRRRARRARSAAVKQPRLHPTRLTVERRPHWYAEWQQERRDKRLGHTDQLLAVDYADLELRIAALNPEIVP